MKFEDVLKFLQERTLALLHSELGQAPSGPILSAMSKVSVMGLAMLIVDLEEAQVDLGQEAELLGLVNKLHYEGNWRIGEKQFNSWIEEFE